MSQRPSYLLAVRSWTWYRSSPIDTIVRSGIALGAAIVYPSLGATPLLVIPLASDPQHKRQAQYAVTMALVIIGIGISNEDSWLITRKILRVWIRPTSS